MLPPTTVPRFPPVVRVSVPPPTKMVPTFRALVSVIDTVLPVLRTETELQLLPAAVRTTSPAPASNVAAGLPVMTPVWVIESAAFPPVLIDKVPVALQSDSTTAPVARTDALAATRATGPPNVLVRL